MADGQRQPRLVGQALQLPFPQPQAPAIAAATIGGDEQSPRVPLQAPTLGAWKIMPVALLRRPRLAPLAARILIVADQFLLLRVHGNDWFAYPQRLFDSAVDISELRVAVGMIAPLLGLAVALQTVTILPQELADFGVAYRMSPGR